jgi:SAM-dependent methyltransferase
MSATTEVKFPVPERFRRGNLRKDERASVDSAHALLAIVDRIAGLAGSRILDFGCGVKLVQALLEREYRQRKYVGVDVYGEMIEYLRSHVTDPRFEFAKLDFHNEMYNKQGERMTGASRLPIADDVFDIITMFSVITHMVPDDALATLKILRGYAAPASRLVFSTFIDPGQSQDFVDKVPDRPLLNAYYRKEFLDALVATAGWGIEAFHPPVEAVIQHHYVCRPV